MIFTPQLQIRPFTVADYEAALAGDTALARHLGVPVAPGWLGSPHVLSIWLKQVKADASLLPWTTYGYFDCVSDALLGGGGFKGRPSAAGVVEIGYGLAPSARGRGLATESVNALVAWAYAQPGVQAVIAHTLATENPSTAVLRRAGFTKTGDVSDPEDGALWRWEHLRAG